MLTRVLLMLFAAFSLATAQAQSADKAKADTATATTPLETYTGTYSSPELPVQIDVQLEKGKLQAQATGQPAFTLEAAGKHEFRYAPAKVVMVFDPEKKQLTLQQGGKSFVFVR
ncbi:DUF3471 domain-containing protein [Flaviaesturariibacter amylovorans]|uniref:Peptidase S12 Pab87-related C-terminal domain-containing protein n=1 Tax=Flaviaesturariibacter amylovorans TaxID=1084520 RepID=A0ABP8G6P2_9BACT